MALSEGAGLARLRARLAARAAEVPVRWVSLDDPEALALSALEPSRSIATTGRAVYWSIRSALESRGAPAAKASEVALRAARAVVLELAGLSRRELVSALGVSGRTVERDRELLRAIGPNSLDGGEFLPRVPASAQRWSAGGVP